MKHKKRRADHDRNARHKELRPLAARKLFALVLVQGAVGARGTRVVEPVDVTESPRDRTSNRDIYSSIETSSSLLDPTGFPACGTGAEISADCFSAAPLAEVPPLRWIFSSDSPSPSAWSI